MTDKLREAAQQALEALEEPQDPVAYNGWVLREVLFDNGEPVGHREPPKAEQPAEQEPFGYFRAEPFGWTDCAPDDEGAIALYEAPQPAKRVPLTDGQIAEIAATPCAVVGSYVHTFARAIEAAHGITGETK